MDCFRLTVFVILIEEYITGDMFSNCELPVVYCEHNFIIVDRYGVEIATCEVKPPGASITEVGNGICRIAESSKRQLHKRIMNAKCEKGMITFGIMFNGMFSVFNIYIYIYMFIHT